MMEVMTGMDSDERLWEARLVADVRAGVRLAENELYAYCADYFWRKYRGVFFVGEEEAAEIFQDAFIALWEHIERGRLVCLDGNMVGKNGAPLTCSILTYFMGIARFKYLEWSRDHAEAIRTADGEDQEDDVTLLDVKEMAAVLYDEETGRCWTSFATLWPECRIGVERFSPSSTMRRRISTRSWKSCRPSAARTPSRPRSINVWRD